MRTKTLLLTAALSAVITASAFAADAVYSVNVVGYVTKHVPTGWSMWANPLQSQDARLIAVLPTPNPGTLFYKWNGSGYDNDVYDELDLVWANGGTNILAPGKGFWLFTSAPFDVTFVGTVLEGTDSNLPLRQGWNLVSSLVPQDGTLATMYTNPLPGALVYKFVNGAYTNDVFDELDLVWGNGGTMQLGPAEGMWVFNGSGASSWDRNFTVPRTP